MADGLDVVEGVDVAPEHGVVLKLQILLVDENCVIGARLDHEPLDVLQKVNRVVEVLEEGLAGVFGPDFGVEPQQGVVLRQWPVYFVSWSDQKPVVDPLHHGQIWRQQE